MIIDTDFLYLAGLILVSLFFLTGIDDFIWDLVSIFQRHKYNKMKIDLKKLESNPPKLLAVAIAAWQESNVLEDVISNFINSTQYPKSMYRVFLGVYPNDEETIEVAKALSKKYANVHLVINDTPGPTSKAQNLNYVITQIKEYEKTNSLRFASLSIHDSEDVIHPYELKVTNLLIDKYPALQFPVFPLMQKPSFKNFFSNLTSSTYADEFAENHFTTMVSRYNTGAFVPSAGTGFALSRETIDLFGEKDVLPNDSLTEDYRLSLTLYEMGINMFYVLEKVPRVADDNKLTWEYIATRSIFPNTFKTAVKQKTRWILGITMQSFKFKDIYKTKKLSFVGRYSLYKDWKAKYGNLLNLLGYPFLIYFIVSLFIELPVIYPKYSLSWTLSLVITIMMIERQLFRGVSVYNVYGLISVFFSCLFPPLLPIRFVWGNIINFTATVKAHIQYIKKSNNIWVRLFAKSKVLTLLQSKQHKKQKTFTWSKTDHVFLEKNVLERYHRKIGDVLLEKGYIDTKTLQSSLQRSIDTNVPLGSLLIEDKISEEQLLDALADVKKIQYAHQNSLKYYNAKNARNFFNQDFLKALLILPIIKMEDGYVFAFCDESSDKAQTIVRKKFDMNIKAVLATREFIEEGIERLFHTHGQNEKGSLVNKLYTEDRVSYEQVVIFNNYMSEGFNENEIIQKMGIVV